MYLTLSTLCTLLSTLIIFWPLSSTPNWRMKTKIKSVTSTLVYLAGLIFLYLGAGWIPVVISIVFTILIYLWIIKLSLKSFINYFRKNKFCSREFGEK